jgi:AbrB family looped-hinge helix DNA binding protein
VAGLGHAHQLGVIAAGAHAGQHTTLLDLIGKAGKNQAMSTATISTKGQLVIPQRYRKALHLEAGDKVTLTLEGEKLSLERERPKRAKLVRGKFGRPVLVAPRGAPTMTPERVKAILDELP